MIDFINFRNCAQEIPQNDLPYPQFFIQPEKQSVKREVAYFDDPLSFLMIYYI